MHPVRTAAPTAVEAAGSRGWSYRPRRPVLFVPALTALVVLVRSEVPAPGRAFPLHVVGDQSCARLAGVACHPQDGVCSVISTRTARTCFTVSAHVVGLGEGLGVEPGMGNQVGGQLGTIHGVAVHGVRTARDRCS